MNVLQSEYCPPIDPALFFAISSDYDLTDPNNLEKFRKTLDELRHAADFTEDIDPANASSLHNGSGLASDHISVIFDDGRTLSSKVSRSDLVGTSHTTESSSVSQSMLSLELEDDPVESTSPTAPGLSSTGMNDYALSLEDLDTDRKVVLLKEMFPNLKEFTISYTLKKSSNSFSKAVEQLLNQVFLEEEDDNGESIIAKGVDGFAENAATRGKKFKGKKRNQKLDLRFTRGTASTPGPLTDSRNGVGTSKWEDMRTDVEFISSRTKMPMQMVSSIYHKNGAVLAPTIRTILQSQVQEYGDAVELDPVAQTNVPELAQEFPSIPASQVRMLIWLTLPSSSAAHELAKALTAKRKEANPAGIEIITRLPPIDLASSDSMTTARTPAATRTSLKDAVALSNTHGTASQAAFAQASVAYQKSKSDHLMGGAAGYYSSIGREHDARAKGYSAAAADALVDGQSSSKELDLHGVSVKDAVRITRERVTTWWVGLGDSRIGGRAGAGKAYKIVTGVGRHSEGGKGRIGPAVGKMLVREGWRVEIGEGVLIVTGVAKRQR